MKGKHAARARNKREADERLSNAVTELRRTKERLENQERLRHEIQALKERLAEVSGQLEQATSPVLERANERAKKLQLELRESRKNYKQLQEQNQRLMEYIRGSEGGAEVMEELIEIANDLPQAPAIVDEFTGARAKSFKGGVAEAKKAIRLQLARGKRSRHSAEKKLRELDERVEERVEVRP